MATSRAERFGSGRPAAAAPASASSRPQSMSSAAQPEAMRAAAPSPTPAPVAPITTAPIAAAPVSAPPPAPAPAPAKSRADMFSASARTFGAIGGGNRSAANKQQQVSTSATAPSGAPISSAATDQNSAASAPRVIANIEDLDFDPEDLITKPTVKLGGNRPTPAAAVRERPRVNYSDQQNEIIHCPAKIIVVKAFAGAGKTTTAVGVADFHPNEKILYVAFNKGIQEEAARRFGPNVVCRTTHSLAYGEVGRHYAKRLARPWRPLTLKNEANLANNREAAIVQSILTGFFHSDDSEINPSHGHEATMQFRASDVEIFACTAAARQVWKRMQDRSDSISLPDDAYLKMWALTKPKLKYDRIIFDEAQDANPVTAQIIRGQTHANLLYIGDPHQSIYGFRGASNAMNDFADAKHLHLSQTWRFGPKIARLANLILGEFKSEKIQIEGMGSDERYTPGSTYTKLARTNAQLFKDAALRKGEGMHWVGGSQGYRLDRLIDAFHLFSGRKSMVTDPFLRNFTSWAEMEAYAEEVKDPETKVLAEVISEFRSETPVLVEMIKANEVKDPKEAQMTVTTGHRAKGLDWDYVQLADDFEILTETEAALAEDPNAVIEEQEINLLYVAVTRAKKKIDLNQETLDWIRALPQHRQARQLAIDKQQRRREQALQR